MSRSIALDAINRVCSELHSNRKATELVISCVMMMMLMMMMMMMIDSDMLGVM